jgi:hypothetical protein
MTTMPSWIKRALVASMFGILDGAACCGEAYDEFKRKLFERASPDGTAFADEAEGFSLFLGVFFLLGYTVFVLFYFGFQN